ncbi:MAG TPA: hypothetical protein VLH61_10155 [Bacteroidales bacterium]|nr:hypothetical protein [Bacteroidales bacterium]
MNTENSPGQILKNLSIIYSAMFVGILIVVGIASLMVGQSFPELPDNPLLDLILLYIAIGLGLILIVLAHGVYHSRLKKLPQNSTLLMKMKIYQKAILTRLALIGVATLISSVTFVITKNTNMILLVAITILFFIMHRPSKFKTAGELRLNAEETELLSQN